MLARESGKTLPEIMGWSGPLTHRQFLTWAAWRAEQWNRPSLTDWYLMRLMVEIRRIVGMFTKNPGSLKLESFRLRFGDKGREQGREMTPEEIKRVSARAKASWSSRLGIGGKGDKKPPVRLPPGQTPQPKQPK